jgi:hypothetical protein
VFPWKGLLLNQTLTAVVIRPELPMAGLEGEEVVRGLRGSAVVVVPGQGTNWRVLGRAALLVAAAVDEEQSLCAFGAGDGEDRRHERLVELHRLSRTGNKQGQRPLGRGRMGEM